jgi:hypothetical protein
MPASVVAVVQRVRRARVDAKERAKVLLAAARALPPFPAGDKTMDNRVMGCTSQVGKRGWEMSLCREDRSCGVDTDLPVEWDLLSGERMTMACLAHFRENTLQHA